VLFLQIYGAEAWRLWGHISTWLSAAFPRLFHLDHQTFRRDAQSTMKTWLIFPTDYTSSTTGFQRLVFLCGPNLVMIGYSWTIGLWAGFAQLTESTQTQNAGQCPWGRQLSQSLPRNAICPPISKNSPAERSNDWAPWTRKPLCVRAHNAHDKTYCTFSSSSFRRGQGINIITTLEGAADVTSAIHDPYFSWIPGIQSADPAIVDRHENSTWEIQDMQEKGKGVIALRDIQPGEVIIVDYPVLAVLSTFKQDIEGRQWRKLIERAVESLPEPSLLFNLAHTSGGEIVDDVIRTNNYGVAFDDHQYMGIFPKVSVGIPC